MSKDTFVWDDKLVAEILRKATAYVDDDWWEKQILTFKQSKMPKKDKDYEVTEIINKHGGKTTKAIDSISWEDYCGLKSFDGFKINAVKRLSDGEVFEVGETIRHTKANEPVKIISFYINDKSEMACLCESPNIHSNYYIENWVKLPPQKEQSKSEQPKKDRIEVKHFKMYEFSEGHVNEVFWYSFCVYKNIPNDKMNSVKAAIERVLNDDEVADSIVPAKVYNQGIGDAMEVVKHHNDKLGLNFPVGLMSQLNDLKKDYLNHKSKQ